jgi:predicted short-subunit dehydrogenase-like oxidoreductase (DUF2520 family)
MKALKSADLRAMTTLLEQHTDIDDDIIELMHPLALAAKANAEDNPQWEEAMSGPYKEGYWKACKKEIDTLTKKMDM